MGKWVKRIPTIAIFRPPHRSLGAYPNSTRPRLRKSTRIAAIAQHSQPVHNMEGIDIDEDIRQVAEHDQKDAQRPTFVAPLVQSLKSTRRKASQACVACRARKVRCDVTQNKPCGNCKWNKHECVLHVRQSHRQKRKSGCISQLSVQQPTPEPLDQLHASPAETTRELTQGQADKTLFEILTIDDAPLQPVQSDLSTSSSSLLSTPIVIDPSESNTNFEPVPKVGNSQLSTTADFPSFIQSPVPQLAPDDLAFLLAKGALSVPDIETQNALIREYLEHVHTLLPLTNLEDFMESISEGGRTQVSLLLFQAVLFAGSAYVALDVLHNAGFATRQKARKTLFRRVQLLYDFNCEPDGLVIIQALLLMTYWYEETNNHKNTWHWMDTAISQAFSQGLHIDPDQSGLNLSLTVRRLRRRIWWSCFMRDRLISLGMRRRSRIRDDDYNVRMLEISDFRSEHLEGERPARTDDVCAYFGDDNRRRTLARICIAQARLCKCLKPSMASQLTIASEDLSIVSTMSGIMPVNGQLFAACQRDLLEWYDELCHSDKYQPISASDIHPDGSANLELNRAVLHMIYHTGVLALHHSRVCDPGQTAGDKELSKVFVQHSAKKISDITKNIEERGLNRFLPMSAVSTIIAAIMVHLLELRGTLQADILHAQENYHRCKRVMQSIKEMYFSTDLSNAGAEFQILHEELEDEPRLLWNPGNGYSDEIRDYEDLFDMPLLDGHFLV